MDGKRAFETPTPPAPPLRDAALLLILFLAVTSVRFTGGAAEPPGESGLRAAEPEIVQPAEKPEAGAMLPALLSSSGDSEGTPRSETDCRRQKRPRHGDAEKVRVEVRTGDELRSLRTGKRCQTS